MEENIVVLWQNLAVPAEIVTDLDPMFHFMYQPFVRVDCLQEKLWPRDDDEHESLYDFGYKHGYNKCIEDFKAKLNE